MRAPISRVLSRSIGFLHRTTPLSSGTRHLCATASPEARTKKLERIADDLLKLNRIELYDYSILFSHKIGLNRYGSAVSVAAGSGGDADASGSAETKTAEKTAFDVKLEKFEAASKIKVIKEIRAFTELGLKEAKELVEKAPCVVKKGLTKEEAEKIMEKLKAVGATVALE
ncbi:unnamed protein product [Microthlaspi erraticum]|uniref:Large ribosomal subunit protein bL12 C-terminal domain-containing protein n=1 Tax=Microthlaspi erraticum TaxID=1685480 RepID=A0A6D2J357_9BRAS|nr:unnamed protein product [Microthlaspi erraticum]